jgi:predicted esterase
MERAIVVIGAILVTLVGWQSSAQDAVLAEFFAAEDASERAEVGHRLVQLSVDFSLLHARLRTGRVYRDDVATGRLEWSRTGAGGEHHAVILVPDDYNPLNRYRVCFYLHGGVNRTDRPENGDTWWRRFDRFDGVEQISVFPASWRGSLWWQPSQIENLVAILDRLETHYNVDENQVFLYGVSDGGSGVYYFAMKASTPWAGYFAFIGHPSVLSNPSTGVIGEMFEGNLVNKPLYVVNGETDRLYPAARVRPYVEAFREHGATVVFRPQPGGHNTRWWNGESPRIEAFMDEHARDPLPERISWETEDPHRFGRFSWLVIDELDLDGNERAGGLFPHAKTSGRIVVDRRGNAIEVAADGVKRYTLLLAPDEIDFDEPLRVNTNGVVSYEGNVERSVETLLKWAARDNDRTMLFGAELTIELE